MSTTLSDLRRARFVQINEEYKNYSGGKLYAEESKIRIEQPLLDGVGQYFIDIKKQNITNQREVSLDRNDVFVPNFIGIFLALQDDTKPACEKLYPYAPINDGVNPSIHPVGFLNEDINALYNGKLTWSIDNGVLFSAFPMERFRRVPETQGAFVLDSQDAPVLEGIESEWDIIKQCELLIPKITVCGTRDHRINVNFDAAGLQFASTTGTTPTLVFYMDGFLVKSGCEYFESKNPNARAVGSWG